MFLHVMNQTAGKVIIEQGRVASNPWSRFVGLMGLADLPEGDGILITRCSSIHSCFMRFPFDVLFVDSQNRVVDLEEAMPAWRARISREPAACVIELPAGTILRTGTRIGHQLVVNRSW